MKNKKLASIQIAAVMLAVALTTPTVPAADIDWGVGAQNITGDSDVSTAGTLVNAFALGPYNATTESTVNGVMFAPYSFPAYGDNVTSISRGNYSFTTTGDFGGQLNAYDNLGTPGVGAYAGLSFDYATLLGNGASATGPYGDGPVTLTMSGLTVGQTYQFQWWANNSSFTASIGDGYLSPWSSASDSDGNYSLLYVNDSSNVGSLGQYAIGTFTADSATQNIFFEANGDDYGDMIINAIQLREITAAPEPSTWALMAVGFIFLGKKFYSRGGRHLPTA